MGKGDWAGVGVIAFLLLGVVTILTFINIAGDVKSFDVYPQREDCIMVDWEINRVSGTDENKSGIYCMEETHND